MIQKILDSGFEKKFRCFAEFQKTYFEIFQRAVNRVLHLVTSYFLVTKTLVTYFEYHFL